MSNLKLPRMTFVALAKNVKPGQTRKLAYATEAHRSEAGDTIKIKQHGNTIAILTPTSLYVTNCGYSTGTTATRLRKILDDNETDYYVRIRNFEMRLYNKAHTEVDPEFYSLTLTRQGDYWCTDYQNANGEAPVRELELSLY